MGDIVPIQTARQRGESQRPAPSAGAPMPLSALSEARERRQRAELDFDAAYLVGNGELSSLMGRLGIGPREFDAATRRFPGASTQAIYRARAARAAAALQQDWRDVTLEGHPMRRVGQAGQ